jgi:iron(III) transport system permease protein
MTTLTLQPVARRRAPWYLVAPALACALAMFVPVAYLILRASQADAEMLRDVVFRGRTLALLGNTVGLSAAVLVVVTILGLPMAWLTTRCALRGRSMLTLLAVLPLAVPGYLMAYTLLSIGGDYGTVSERLGVTIPRLSGFPAALIALSLYNLPYMFLNLRVAMQRMDPALEEAARSLGLSPRRVFLRVVLPQLRPALWAGGLLVTLHVIGDFGVVSLTRFETFSYALYQHVESNDKAGAAWLGLMLIVLTAGLLVFELRFLRGLRLDPAGAATSRIRRPLTLGRWAPAAYIFLLGIAAAGVAVPLATISFWCVRAAERGAAFGQAWLGAVADSMSVSVPAAVLTTALALPLAYLARRYPSPMSRGLEQSAYIGYATPSLAFALGLVFFTLLLPRTLDAWHERLVDWPVIARVVGAASNAIAGLYQTLGLLIIAYSLRDWRRLRGRWATAGSPPSRASHFRFCGRGSS